MFNLRVSFQDKCKGCTVRDTPLNPLSMPHAAATNKGAAAITYVGGVQAGLDIEEHKVSEHVL